MKYTAGTSLDFSAGHTLEPNRWCGDKPHGHRYRVVLRWDREGFPKTDHDHWIEYRERALAVVLELKDRDLGKMLGAQVPNVFGVASFFMERLAINVPVNKVVVHEDDGPVAIIERDTNN